MIKRNSLENKFLKIVQELDNLDDISIYDLDDEESSIEVMYFSHTMFDSKYIPYKKYTSLFDSAREENLFFIWYYLFYLGDRLLDKESELFDYIDDEKVLNYLSNDSITIDDIARDLNDNDLEIISNAIFDSDNADELYYTEINADDIA